MPNQESRIDELRSKRAKSLEAQERRRLRATYGPQLAAIIAKATDRPVKLDDFVVDLEEPFPFDWPADITTAPGLVEAYIAKHAIINLLKCFREKIGNVTGKIGFHEKSYLGLASLEKVNPVTLADASEAAEDFVLFYVDSPRGVIAVDCYTSQPSEPFSVIVQGSILIHELAPCFNRS